MNSLHCPHCGSNSFQPFGPGAYKCDFCDGILREDKKGPVTPPPPPVNFGNTDVLNTRPDDGKVHDPEKVTNVKILIVLLLFLAMILGVAFRSCDRTEYVAPADPGKPDPIDELTKQFMPEPLPDDFGDFELQPFRDYLEDGITVKKVDLLVNGTVDTLGNVADGDKLYIVLRKPKGFTREGKDVFAGFSFVIQANSPKMGDYRESFHESGDLNIVNGMIGQDYHDLKDSIAIPVSVGGLFGFTKNGYYLLHYRVWDQKSDKQLTGDIPLTYGK